MQINYKFKNKTLSPCAGQRFFVLRKSVVVLVLALLVCNAARGLASRLARGLALAAAAVLNGVCDILGFDSLDSCHDMILRLDKILVYLMILSQKARSVNKFCAFL